LETRIAANRIYVLWRCGDLQSMEMSLASEIARLGRDGLVEAAGGQLLVGRAVVLHALGRWAELTEHLESTLADPGRLPSQVEILLRLIAVEMVGDLGRLSVARAGLAALLSLPGASDPEIAYELMSVRLTIATLAGDLPRADRDALAEEATTLVGAISGDPFAAARVRVGVLRLWGWASDSPTGPLTEGQQFAASEDSPPAGDAVVEGTETDAVAPVELTALLAEERAWRTGTGWREVAAAWQRLPMPHRVAWAQLSAALEAAHLGEESAALALVDEARATARALNAEPLGAAADRLDRQLGRRSRRTSGDLTAREGDVVAQVSLGRTNREIAKALGMSERTVAVHLTRIFAKLGAGTRGEVAHIARHRGLIPESGGRSAREEQQ
jgi:DNA-binding CsgD family transcriptional regulator